jgi:soluble lytic murein transglycosylase-like protein
MPSRLPKKTMNLRSNSIAAKLLAPLVLFTASAPAPARAQVVSVLDEHNQRVFINLAPVAPKLVVATKPDASAAEAAKVATLSSWTSPISAKSPAVQSTPASNSTGPQRLTNDRLEELIQTTAARHHVDPALVRAVMETESGGNPTAVSRKGALGLMQLMPNTAIQLGVKNVFSPDDNLEAGVRYLRSMLEHYNGDLDKSLAAYNAGMGAVDRAGGVPRYRETRDYVRKVTNNYFSSDAGKVGTLGASRSPMTGGTNALAAGAPKVTHKMYKSVDAQGHVVWSND